MGPDGYQTSGVSSMKQVPTDPNDIVWGTPIYSTTRLMSELGPGDDSPLIRDWSLEIIQHIERHHKSDVSDRLTITVLAVVILAVQVFQIFKR